MCATTSSFFQYPSEEDTPSDTSPRRYVTTEAYPRFPSGAGPCLLFAPPYPISFLHDSCPLPTLPPPHFPANTKTVKHQTVTDSGPPSKDESRRSCCGRWASTNCGRRPASTWRSCPRNRHGKRGRRRCLSRYPGDSLPV